MVWSAQKQSVSQVTADLLTVGMHQVDDQPDPAALQELDRVIPSGLAAMQRSAAFNAKAESMLLLPRQDATGGWLLLVGFGPREEVSLDLVRRLGGLVAGRLRDLGVAAGAVLLPAGGPGGYDARTVARCWVEGAGMAVSAKGELKTAVTQRSSSDPAAVDWLLVTRDGRKLRRLRRGIAEGEAHAAGCTLSRRLVNLPGNRLTPDLLGKEARRVAKSSGLACQILGPTQLEKHGMGGLLAVGQGSVEPPCLIVLKSRPSAPAPRRPYPLVALVGKGVTFDSGGISLKPPASMEKMKSDMAGAAAVLGAARIITQLQLKVRLLVAVPAVESMPDARALKPGDVITMASGKTVEVLNTDAEGRLILADALHYVCQQEPDYVIDIATLTGACENALGSQFAGLMSTSAELLEVLGQAGGETFERLWHLPLIDAHHQEIESDIADLKNLGGRKKAGASTAAAFLAEFVARDTAWAHLDIAGTAWTDKAGPLGPKGATGFGARLLARAVEILVS
ncbi:MAG: leucyl aminopeptidase [bacterium]